MASHLIGIAFTSSALGLALVKQNRILSLISVPLPQGLVDNGRITDPAPLAAILAKTRKSHGIRCRKCALVLPPQQILRQHLTLPISPGQIPDPAPFFRDYVGGDPEAYDYDSIVTETGDADCTLYATAVPKAIPEEYGQVCRLAGLVPVLAIPEEMAWRNLIRNQPGLPEKLAILDPECDLPGIRIFHRSNFVMSKELDQTNPAISSQIEKAINLYNYGLPPEEAMLRDLYCRAADRKYTALLSDTGSWKIHSVSDFLDGQHGGVAMVSAAAAGAALQGWLPNDTPKQTMNFIRRNAGFDLRRFAPAALAAVLILLLFVQLGILSPLRKKAQAYENLSRKQEQLEQIRNRLADFPELEQQYLRYGTGLMEEAETALVSRIAVLNLAQTLLGEKATIESLTLNQNILTVYLRNITLEEAGGIVALLESSDLVSSAAIHSATADDGSQARILLSITLADATGKEEAHET